MTKNSFNAPLTLSILDPDHIPTIVASFEKIGWTDKSKALFERYGAEQDKQERHCWVAYVDQEFAGYVTLKWRSDYPPFTKAGIPEIVDLNVLPIFRKHGIGSTLLEKCEQLAATRSPIVGIGVGLYPDYGAAQRLYVKRGYIPDGRGINYDGIPVVAGEVYPADDSLALYFTKTLR